MNCVGLCYAECCGTVLLCYCVSRCVDCVLLCYMREVACNPIAFCL